MADMRQFDRIETNQSNDKNIYTKDSDIAPSFHKRGAAGKKSINHSAKKPGGPISPTSEKNGISLDTTDIGKGIAVKAVQERQPHIAITKAEEDSVLGSRNHSS